MTPDKLLVIALGLASIAAVVWFFWGPRSSGYRVPVTASGYQEAMILVKGGYTPDVLLVERGKPVRLNFRREESEPCSEMVVLPDFNKSALLPLGETVGIEFLPHDPGEHEFSCQMGMIRGRLVVRSRL